MVGDRRRLEAPSSSTSTGSQVEVGGCSRAEEEATVEQRTSFNWGEFPRKQGRAAVVSEKVIVPEKLLNC